MIVGIVAASPARADDARLEAGPAWDTNVARIQGDETREDGLLVRIYEHRKTGETFLIPEPRLRLDQLEDVQRQVVTMLGGKPPGQPAPSGQPAPPAATEPSGGKPP